MSEIENKINQQTPKQICICGHASTEHVREHGKCRVANCDCHQMMSKSEVRAAVRKAGQVPSATDGYYCRQDSAIYRRNLKIN